MARLGQQTTHWWPGSRHPLSKIGIGTRKLWELTNRGDIPAAKIGRAVLYRLIDLDAWLAAQTAKGVRR